MLSRFLVYKSDSLNPYHNLAIEKFLFDSLDENTFILYLWRNRNTVVIGRNQNPWVECRCALLESEGGYLARRLSGGGAVFHDEGNLNFTFLSTENHFSIKQNCEIIKNACALAGIDAQITGRNDITVNGKKFSGNAFYNIKNKKLHHGTILINSNSECIERYLTPKKEKLQSKGVKSVKSRVINLCQINPLLDREIMSDYLVQSAEKILGLSSTYISNIQNEIISEYEREFSSWDYLYGKTIPFSFSTEKAFKWGHIQLNLNIASGVIKDIQLFTDSMQWELSDLIESALLGCRINDNEIKSRLYSCLPKEIAQDILSLITTELS